MKENKSFAHLLAIFTTLIWGTTFVSTKYLLQDFLPVEILFIRFLVGFISLCIIYPRELFVFHKNHELYFIGAGFTGITLYYLLENIALTYTTASNVGIIVSVSPLFIALCSRIFLHEVLHTSFFIGFVFAISGIAAITFNAGGHLAANPLGDLLAVLAAVTWAFYSILTKKIAVLHYNMFVATRKMFLYGLIFMIPIFYWQGGQLDFSIITVGANFFNLCFLSVGASAICFITWNMAIKRLGAASCSAYIYLIPIVTIITAVLFLNEKVTVNIIAGCALTLIGLLISENRLPFIKQKKNS